MASQRSGRAREVSLHARCERQLRLEDPEAVTSRQCNTYICAPPNMLPKPAQKLVVQHHAYPNPGRIFLVDIARSVPRLATEAVIATTHAEEASMGRSKEREGC